MSILNSIMEIYRESTEEERKCFIDAHWQTADAILENMDTSGCSAEKPCYINDVIARLSPEELEVSLKVFVGLHGMCTQANTHPHLLNLIVTPDTGYRMIESWISHIYVAVQAHKENDTWADIVEVKDGDR